MNPYLRNLEKIEFVVTDACTGKCRHCSEGDHTACGKSIDPQAAAYAVRRIAGVYDIKTVMAFGGEPLLCVDAVEAIMRIASDLGIERRQVITNGFFSRDTARIASVAALLADCGVNDLLLSVDAFHQETIPLAIVRRFAAEAVRCGIPIRLQPAWLVRAADDNPYNRKTRALLESLADLCIPMGEGNVIFPEGNALKHLAAYFGDTPPKNPYVEDPRDVRCVSFSPNGDVLDGNVYRQDAIAILEKYSP